MSGYAWIITKDHLADDDPETFKSNVGVTGPADADPAHLSLLAKGKGRTFYMYDDDGECYYTGRCVWTPMPAYVEWEFAPLDDFGLPNAGCTQIKWHGNGGMS